MSTWPITSLSLGPHAVREEGAVGPGHPPGSAPSSLPVGAGAARGPSPHSWSGSPTVPFPGTAGWLWGHRSQKASRKKSVRPSSLSSPSVYTLTSWTQGVGGGPRGPPCVGVAEASALSWRLVPGGQTTVTSSGPLPWAAVVWCSQAASPRPRPPDPGELMPLAGRGQLLQEVGHGRARRAQVWARRTLTRPCPCSSAGRGLWACVRVGGAPGERAPGLWCGDKAVCGRSLWGAQGLAIPGEHQGLPPLIPPGCPGPPAPACSLFNSP